MFKKLYTNLQAIVDIKSPFLYLISTENNSYSYSYERINSICDKGSHLNRSDSK